jgi:hypothetical protein
VQPNGTIRLLRPGPRWLTFPYPAWYRVEIDGVEAGQLWAKQVRSFSVAAGEHEVRVGRLPFRVPDCLSVEVQSGEIVDLALGSEWAAALGRAEFHPATDKEKALIERLSSVTAPIPRNLSSRSDQT